MGKAGLKGRVLRAMWIPKTLELKSIKTIVVLMFHFMKFIFFI